MRIWSKGWCRPLDWQSALMRRAIEGMQSVS
jgi:hypothetical protein